MATKMKSKSGVEYTLGSGNVFADLNLPDADDLQFKSGLIFQINQAIEARGLTQAAAAKIIGMDQPTLSKMLRGRFLSCSADRLFGILNRLGRSVEVRVSAEEVEDARTLVMAT